MNQNKNNVQIPLKGLTIGDGMMDPQTQTQGIAKQAYMFSMFDENQREVGIAYESVICLFFFILFCYFFDFFSSLFYLLLLLLFICFYFILFFLLISIYKICFNINN